ncbi:MAG: hypothetical protein WAZ94_07270 [Phycisphaerales bacterium]
MTTTAKTRLDLAPVYRQNKGLTSLVSYPDRCSLWGDARYRGNCDGRLFNELVLRYGARSVADPMMGSGTTRDVIAGLNRFLPEPIEYWGGDLRHGYDLATTDLPGRYDFVWIHPPYWNIIRYSDDPADLSTIETYPDFRAVLARCLRRCAAALVPGGRLAVLVGDVRRRGQYTPIVRDVLRLEPDLGELRSVIIKAQHNCRSDSVGYAAMEDVPIRHEYCVVFKRSKL